MEAFLFCGKTLLKPFLFWSCPKEKWFQTSVEKKRFLGQHKLNLQRRSVKETQFSAAALTLQCAAYPAARPFLMSEYLHGAWDGDKRTTYQCHSLNTAGPAGVRRSREVNATPGQKQRIAIWQALSQRQETCPKASFLLRKFETVSSFGKTKEETVSRTSF